MADEKIIKTLSEKLNLTMNLLADDADKPVLVTVADIKDALDLFNRQKAEIHDLKSTLLEIVISYDAMRGAANSYKMHYENKQAELERLEKHNKEYGFCNLLGNCLVYSKNLKDYNDMRKGLNAEAIKEFAELIKKAFPSIAEAVDCIVKENEKGCVKECEID